MAHALSLLLVALTGCFFLTLAVLALRAPARASGFLMGFASSAATHYAELAVRVLLGLAFLAQAAQAPWPPAFWVFGGLLVGTSAVLLLIPWRWHQAFARHSVPQALRFLPLIGIASLAMGGYILFAVWHLLGQFLR